MATAKKRPCRECRRWFVANARLSDRQRTCSREECQEARRAATQAAWRGRHPDYDRARRIQERTGAEAAGEEVALSRAPPPLDRLPWDLAQNQFMRRERRGCSRHSPRRGSRRRWWCKEVCRSREPSVGQAYGRATPGACGSAGVGGTAMICGPAGACAPSLTGTSADRSPVAGCATAGAAQANKRRATTAAKDRVARARCMVMGFRFDSARLDAGPAGAGDSRRVVANHAWHGAGGAGDHVETARLRCSVDG
jgi:hypothetical protein